MPLTDGRTGEPHFKLKLQNSLVRLVCAFSKHSQILANGAPGLSEHPQPKMSLTVFLVFER